MSNNFIKKPCQHCPFRNDVKPFLRPSRAEELAYAATNPYSTFPCHKTTVVDDGGTETVVTDESKECAGFLTLRAQELGEDEVRECKHGFVPSYDIVYSDAHEMICAYEQEDC